MSKPFTPAALLARSCSWSASIPASLELANHGDWDEDMIRIMMPFWHHSSRWLHACLIRYGVEAVPETPFGSFLNGRLRSLGWSQRHFSDLVDIHQAQLGRIVRGLRRPPLEHLGIWAQVLGLDASSTREMARLALLEHKAAWITEHLVPVSSKRAAEPNQHYDTDGTP